MPAGNCHAKAFDPARPSTASIRWHVRRTRTRALKNAFIGDYFGLAISAGNVYTLSVSTHYPSSVRADGGGRVYYQQQILGTVQRSAIGTGY